MKRKIFAISLSAIMILSTVPVSAAYADLEGTEIIVDGDTEYVDIIDTPIDVTVPTVDSLKFALDPQGLAALEDGESELLDDLSEYAGKIKSSGIAYVTNESAYPLSVTATLKAVPDESLTLVTTETAVETTTPATDDDISTIPKNVLFYMEPAAADMSIPVAMEITDYTALENYPFDGTATEISAFEDLADARAQVEAEERAFVGSKKAYNISDEDGTVLKYYIKGANQVITNTGGVKTAADQLGSGQSFGFKVGGLCNSSAIGWPKATETTSPLSLSMVFDSTRNLSTEPAAADYVTGAFGVLSAGAPASSLTLTYAEPISRIAASRMLWGEEGAYDYDARVEFILGEDAKSIVADSYTVDGRLYKDDLDSADIDYADLTGNVLTIKKAFFDEAVLAGRLDNIPVSFRVVREGELTTEEDDFEEEVTIYLYRYIAPVPSETE